MQILLSLVDMVRPYLGVVVPAVFFGFFVVAGVAIFWGRNRYVSRTYLVWFFTILLVVNVAISVIPIPFVHWHKFSDPRPQEQTRYMLRVADADGDEIRYDNKATWNVGGANRATIRAKFRGEFDAEQKRVVSSYLLQRANDRRTRLQRPPWVRFLKFPPHGTGSTWTRENLAEFGPFVSISMYRVEVVTSEDGREIVSSSEDRVFFYHRNGTMVDRICNSDDCTPTSRRLLLPPGRVTS